MSDLLFSILRDLLKTEDLHSKMRVTKNNDVGVRDYTEGFRFISYRRLYYEYSLICLVSYMSFSHRGFGVLFSECGANSAGGLKHRYELG